MAVLFSLSECSKGNFVQIHLLLVASFIEIELICTLINAKHIFKWNLPVLNFVQHLPIAANNSGSSDHDYCLCHNTAEAQQVIFVQTKLS